MSVPGFTALSKQRHHGKYKRACDYFKDSYLLPLLLNFKIKQNMKLPIIIITIGALVGTALCMEQIPPYWELK